jgi:translation initiation factor IF-1
MAKKEAPYRKSVTIKIPSQNLVRDPRAKGSIRGSSARIPTGDKVTVKGTGAARKQTATWF